MGSKCHSLHKIHHINHCLPLAKDSPVVGGPRGLSPWCQGYSLCPDFHVWLPCHVSYSMFQRCLAEPSGVIICLLRTYDCLGGAGDKM